MTDRSMDAAVADGGARQIRDDAPPAVPEVTDAPERGRYEAHLDGTLAGVLEYEIRRNRMILVHTEVAPAFEGRGIGSAIVRFALADARRRGLPVTPACPYVKGYLARHPEALAGSPSEAPS